MFTGIIEAMGRVISLDPERGNLNITIECPFTNELKIDQSVSHNGVCLTVVEINNNAYKVTAVDETLRKSNLGLLKAGDMINLERSMVMNGRLDGHIVQGHVDQTAVCISKAESQGSWLYSFSYEQRDDLVTVSKGSICINGVSLTVVDSQPGSFSVAIIPYTYEHTNFRNLEVGSVVNLEFDILGKYVAKFLSLQKF